MTHLNKNIVSLIQLTATTDCPKTYMLVQFAFKAYKVYKNETLTLSVRHC
jgi:hypothetical protein